MDNTDAETLYEDPVGPPRKPLKGWRKLLTGAAMLAGSLLSGCGEEEGIEGTVKDAAGDPVDGAYVYIRSPSDPSRMESVARVEDGEFTLPEPRNISNVCLSYRGRRYEGIKNACAVVFPGEDNDVELILPFDVDEDTTLLARDSIKNDEGKELFVMEAEELDGTRSITVYQTPHSLKDRLYPKGSPVMTFSSEIPLKEARMYLGANLDGTWRSHVPPNQMEDGIQSAVDALVGELITVAAGTVPGAITGFFLDAAQMAGKMKKVKVNMGENPSFPREGNDYFFQWKNHPIQNKESLPLRLEFSPAPGEAYAHALFNYSQSHMAPFDTAGVGIEFSTETKKPAPKTSKPGKFEGHNSVPFERSSPYVLPGADLHGIKWLPDNESIVYNSVGDIFLLDMRGKRTINLTETPERHETNFTVSPDSTIYFAGKKTKYHKLFSLFSLRDGDETLLAENVSEYSLSPDGERVAFEQLEDKYRILRSRNGKETKFPDGKTRTLYLMDTGSGKKHPVKSDEIGFYDINFSPDSSRLAFITASGSPDPNTYVFQLGTKDLAGIETIASDIVWSLDGRLLYADQSHTLSSINMNGMRVKNLDDDKDFDDFVLDGEVSPDKSRIVYSDRVPGYPSKIEIFESDIYGNNERQLTPHTPGVTHGYPAWSPRGDKIAYISFKSNSSATENEITSYAAFLHAICPSEPTGETNELILSHSRDINISRLNVMPIRSR